MVNNGKIYICCTPIGNIGDVSTRLKEALSNSDIIYAEDTRVTSKLLLSLDIKKPVKRLDQNTMHSQLNNLIDCVYEGRVVSYCSDAGMPGVSDPGLQIVDLAHKNNINIEVLPGPSAAIMAFVASGFNNPNFYFNGFLPRKNGDKINVLNKLKNINGVIIIFESPKRLLSTLNTIADIYKNLEISICRELTKLHEEIIRGSIPEVIKNIEKKESVKGEIVICINNIVNNNKDYNNEKLNKFAKSLIDNGLKTNDVADLINFVFDIPKNKSYQLALNNK